jgi:polar amino acid transport system substrate-binding protein
MKYFTRPYLQNRFTRFFAALLIAGLACPALAADKIHLVTESYPPMNYSENGQLKGVSVELLQKAMADSGVAYDMEVMPWARAYALAENEKGYCVFTAVHNAERDKKFQWVEPLLHGYAYLIKKKGSDVHAKTIEEARKYLIGTQRGDYTVGVLKSMQFDRIDLASEINLTLNKLLMGRIDLMPMAGQLVVELQKKGTEIEPLLLLVSNVNGLACNKNIPPETVAKIQESLNKRIADGTQAAIFKKYGFVEGVK